MMNITIQESNKLNLFIRNNSASNASFNDIVSPTKRPVINNILQRLKSPLKRSRVTKSLSLLQQFIDQLVITQGFSIERDSDILSSYKLNPTRIQIASYGSAVTAAVEKNTSKLQSLFEAGIAFNPYDPASKEFLVHTACTNGNLAVLKLMIQFGGAEITQCIDSFGRTPLHNVCWNGEKIVSDDRLEMVKVLLMCNPNMIYVKDCNGAEPFSYVSENQHKDFMSYLNENKHIIWTNRRNEAEVIRSVPIIQTIEIVEMLASGRMDPTEVELLQYDEQCYDSENSSTDGSIHGTNFDRIGLNFKCPLWDGASENEDDNDDSISTTNELADILESISRTVNKHF
jgi:Ankyrin repeats (many copies)